MDCQGEMWGTVQREEVYVDEILWYRIRDTNSVR